MAIAGVLVAAPQAHAAAGQAAEATTAVVQIRTDALLTHDAPAAQQEPARRYTEVTGGLDAEIVAGLRLRAEPGGGS